MAINLGQATKDKLKFLSYSFRGLQMPIKWVHPEMMQITVKYIGDIEDDKLKDIEKAVKKAVKGLKSFSITLHDGIYFPNEENPRVLGISVEDCPEIEDITSKVRESLDAAGFEGDAKPFSAHVTIGRVQSVLKPAHLERVTRLVFRGETEVKSIDVMTSTLTPRGPRYKLEARISLDK